MATVEQTVEVKHLSAADKATLRKSVNATEGPIKLLTSVIDVSRTHLHNVLLELSESDGSEAQIESLYQAIRGTSKLDLVNKCHISTLEALEEEIQNPNFSLEQFEKRVRQFEADFQTKVSGTVTEHKVENHEWTKESLEFLKNQFPQKYKEGAASDMDSEDDIIVGTGTTDYQCKITYSLMVEPRKNTVCGHRYSKAGIMQMLSNHPSIKCPISGCGKTVKKGTLVQDPMFEKGLKRHQRSLDSQQHEEGNVETID